MSYWIFLAIIIGFAVGLWVYNVIEGQREISKLTRVNLKQLFAVPKDVKKNNIKETTFARKRVKRKRII